MRHFDDDAWFSEWQRSQSWNHTTEDIKKLVDKLQKSQRGFAETFYKEAVELERRRQQRRPNNLPPPITPDDNAALQYREREITRLQSEIKNLRGEIKLIISRQLERRIAEWKDVRKSPTALRHIAEQREAQERRAAEERAARERQWQEEQRRRQEEFWRTVRPSQPGPDPLTVLNLPSNATPEQIQTRFRTLVKRLHPDTNGGDVAAIVLFRQVIQAMQQLRRSGRV